MTLTIFQYSHWDWNCCPYDFLWLLHGWYGI